ncbi:MAG: glycosyltransferase family 4 protein [Deltaproteobacteria bacterium]|nr:glycosyltransferase family 4 protein [Deltaproteobacteria bacterium]
MKVALVCKKYSLQEGGLERYTYFLSRELVRAGHEVHIFANIWQEEPGVIIHRVPVIRLSSPAKNLSFAFFTNRALSKMKFDIIHSMERIFYQDIFRVSDGINPVQMQQKYPHPVVRFIKKIGPRRIALSYLEHRIFVDKGCKIVMTNSELVKRNIIEHYRVDPENIVVIYNGVNTSRFNPKVKEKFRSSLREKYGIKKEELVLIFVSNDFKLKRLDLVLEAMAFLKNNKIRLFVIGADNHRTYRRWSDNHSMGKQILFLGPKSNIEKYYAGSDIFVLPTLYDAFANVCLEAMACGLPVITTDSNGAADLISDNENGYILKTQKADELAAGIKALEPLSNRTRMGDNAAAKAACFTMEKHVTKVLKLYERVSSKGQE